jgi:uncharacterized protein YvpB
MRRAPLAALAIGIMVVAAAALAVAGRDEPSPPAPPPPPPAPLAIRAGPGEAELSPTERERVGSSDAAARAWLDERTAVRGARVTARVSWTARDARALARAAAGTAPTVVLAPRVEVIEMKLPVVKQVYRNNCETAALSMALGGTVSQRTLQAGIPQALPVDPEPRADGTVWGDPDAGFVGRVEGGGFGVFEQPLVRLGRRYDPGVEAVRTATFEGVLNRVRAGHPVVAWTGLGPSAPWSWRTPAGKVINADRSHHTVVIAGVGPDGVTIHDPWTGTASVVSAPSLASGWERLGRHAVATSALGGQLVAVEAGDRTPV